ncbi:uncharacterized protein LTR77_001365 [Saxophila tyrrhenica]|uniref:Uncharacterized protein n=1 Tax=Saxophila tyrrhenica TaxID=1690608 RepID=A0AAV9PKL1_9PEZI|nr:hypothetical protein LTR77_001365 [Saxophila tyrrhenica]
MPPSRRIILLAGAPLADCLDWDERHGHASALEDTLGDQTATSQYPTWRSVELGPTRNLPMQDEASDFRRTPVKPNKGKAKQKRARSDSQEDFLEHSLALLDSLDSSQLLPTTAYQGPTTSIQDISASLLCTTSFSTSDTSYLTTSDSILPDSSPELPSLPQNLPITDLRRLPTAQHITSIHPQTITLNLLCALISLSPSRIVPIRRRPGTEMEIIELTVGDDTRAGFTISFWLVPEKSQQARRAEDAELREKLRGLRKGDVVLLRNVALSEFRGVVYGQSLMRRRFARMGTEVVVVGEGVEIRDGVMGKKVGRVREWVGDFVGRERGESGLGKKRRGEELPPDTQE